METLHRGNSAEAAVLDAFAERNLRILLPFGSGHPYDLAVELPPTGFLRVQCKCARRYRGCALFNSRTTDHGNGRLPYTGLADVFGVFLPETRAVYVVPVEEATVFVVSLRLQPPLNNQKRRIRLAADYEIGRWTNSSLRALIPG